jgi:hypothetical protein
MDHALEESGLAPEPNGAPLVITFAIITGAGIVSWALMLAGLYGVWAAIRSFI